MFFTKSGLSWGTTAASSFSTESTPFSSWRVSSRDVKAYWFSSLMSARISVETATRDMEISSMAARLLFCLAT